MEKPIIFSTPMVRAILDGRKTMTRRVVKPQPIPVTMEGEEYLSWSIGRPYRPGDILWVRETFCPIKIKKPTKALPESFKEAKYLYKADEIENSDDTPIKWKPSIHMPKEVARIWLKVTDVRIEQLQDITENDAIKEGFTPVICTNCRGFGCSDCSGSGKQEPALLEFHHSWDGIYAKRGYGWDKNPWVWVIEFELYREWEAGKEMEG